MASRSSNPLALALCLLLLIHMLLHTPLSTESPPPPRDIHVLRPSLRCLPLLLAPGLLRPPAALWGVLLIPTEAWTRPAVS